MVTYLVLYKFTDSAMGRLQELPQGIAAVHQAVADAGGQVLACYLLVGEYDSVGIYTFPTDEVALGLLLGIGSQGFLRTTSLKAFSPEQVAEIMARKP